MTEQGFGPGEVILFILTALVGAFSVVEIAGRGSPTRQGTPAGGLQADLLIYPIAIGLAGAAIIVA